MNLVIIESPYAGDVERNTVYARRACLNSLRGGEVPFASHLFFTQFLDDTAPKERAQGIEAGYDFWTWARKVAFYVDYGMSPGMLQAKERAVKSGYQIENRTIGKNPK